MGPLRATECRERVVRRAPLQWIQARFEPHDEPDGPREDLSANRKPIANGSFRLPEQFTPLVRDVVVLSQGERYGPFRRSRDVDEHRELLVDVAKIAHHLKDAPSLAAERAGDPDELGA